MLGTGSTFTGGADIGPFNAIAASCSQAKS
jgi:hypothetical protein